MKDNEYIKVEDLGVKPDLDMINLDHHIPERGMLYGGVNKIGICVGAVSTTMAERLLATRNLDKDVILINPNNELDKDVLIKNIRDYQAKLIEADIYDQKFRTYMFGETFNNFNDIRRHLKIFDPFEVKDNTNQDLLIKNDFNTFKKLEDEYLLIKNKQSKLSRILRDTITKVYEIVTK